MRRLTACSWPIWGKTEICELWWIIGSEEWCSRYVTRRQSREGLQFIGTTRVLHKFGMRWSCGGERVSHRNATTVAHDWARSWSGNWLSLVSNCDVVTRLMAWRDRGKRRPPRQRLHGHVAGQVGMARQAQSSPSLIFSPRGNILPESSTNHSGRRKSLRKDHRRWSAMHLWSSSGDCTMAISFSSSDRATSGRLFFDFHATNHSAVCTKVVPLYTSLNFVTKILVKHSLDRALFGSKVDPMQLLVWFQIDTRLTAQLLVHFAPISVQF
jgi:hypothetical protein